MATERSYQVVQISCLFKGVDRKDGLDVMNKMLDSFKEQYKDEAEFDITVEIQADSQVRDVMLTDVHNGADVFSFPDDQIISLTAGGF